MKRFLLAAAIGVLVCYPGAVRTSAQGNALAFFKNYFITGDYVVGGTSLWRKGVNGRATEEIRVAGVPTGVDVVAAFLYVQTAETVQWSGIDHATFNGQDLGAGNNSLAKALNWEAATRPCWSVAWPGGRRLVTYRADVLRFLPIGSDGKYAVNGEHSVQVPDYGAAFSDLDEFGEESASQTGARAVGASLVVVYRDPTQPFRGVVIYDGGVTKQAFSRMSLMLTGFYQASATPGAKMTHIVGDGRPYLSERVRVNGNLIATNPYASTDGPKWDNPTFADVPVLPGSSAAALEITPNGLFSDCVSPSAVVFSTEVQDSDGDGLIDIWEASDTPVIDPVGRALPNLKAMGADPLQKDLFIEVGYLQTAADTTYGGVTKPAHSHLPPHDALKRVGDAFANAPNGRINVHFDVGDLYPSGVADPYIIRGAGLARGGEAIDELATVCTPGATDAPYVCQFSRYPGTVGWKAGFRYLRDEVLSVTPPPGVAPPPPGDEFCDTPGYTCNRRFDAVRSTTFRYALFAHALGLPKSEFPCVDAAGHPVADVNDVCAVGPNPDFHEPRTNTGIGDFPGADVMVTLGAFDDVDGKPVGTPFMQASTLMHELGHNFERRHGGEALEPNCKPTYLSVMNYLYQLRGLLDDGGTPHLDFSPRVEATLDEAALSDASLLGLTYRLGWYAPLQGSYLEGQGRAATRHCDGSDLLPTDAAMVRIDARTAAGGLDWNANSVTDAAVSLDINFNGRVDGTPGAPLAGSDDWSNLRLNQIGSRRNVGGLYVYTNGGLTSFAVGPLSVDVGKGDLGKGDLGKGDLGKGDLGKGDLGKGDLGKGDLGKGDLGKGDLGKGDLGGGDLFLGDPNNPGGELDFETATSLGKTPPNEFDACIVGVDCVGIVEPLHDIKLAWTAPTVGGVSVYTVYRVAGPDLVPGQAWIAVGTVDPTLLPADAVYSFLDGTDLPNGERHTYFVVATYTDGTQSDPSNLVTITAVNDPPSAVGDTYATNEDTPLVQVAPGVLANDTDDSLTPLTAILVSQAAHGIVVLADDGSFTYTPAANYNGMDAFTYSATDGSVVSPAATVDITIDPVNDPPVAVPDLYTTAEDTPLTLGPPGVLRNDTDVDAATILNASVVTGPSHGTLLLNLDGSFAYTPALDYHGPDGFSYRANDGAADSNTVTVGFTVTPVNDPPVTLPDSYTTAEDMLLTVAATSGVLANDTDADGTLSAAVASAPVHGTLVLNANGSFTYAPAADYNGPDAFTYTATDGVLTSAPTTVTLAITPVNDAPVAVGESYTMDQGTTLVIEVPSVLANDTDVDSPTLTAMLVTPPANGTFTLGADGSFRFTPVATFSGQASFTYKASDGTASSNTATVSITVNAVGYGFVNVKNLPPAPGVTFKPSSKGTLVDFEWKFTKNGSIVASGDAQPAVTITGPGGFNQTFTPANCAAAGIKFEYKADARLWDFHWTPRNAAAGTYSVVVNSAKTGQRFPAAGGFPVVFKN